ncbi:MAG: hypothetical protein IT282_13120, partial [Bacteroidetes bacterium]|nr:hypothetical protein [Bacteroidota bacterium]
MIQTRLVVVLAICVALCGVQGLAQTGEELNHDQATAARHVSPVLEQLSKELSLARKAGDVNRAREIEAQLFTSLPSVPESDAPAVIQGTDADMGYVAADPQWGNDVKVYTGGMYSHGKRQIAMDVDTLGGIYLAMNVKYHDTLSFLRAYRSTNGGRSWSYINGFMSSSRAIQSFDLCVTD